MQKRTPPAPRQRMKREDRERQIVEEAVRYFSEVGFTGETRELARRLQITQPALIKRVEPEYPPLAVKAHIQGVVILEATVGEDGNVVDVKLLRPANPLLDREAAIAVRQWRYTPVVLNGTRVPFILTVTLSFSLEVTK